VILSRKSLESWWSLRQPRQRGPLVDQHVAAMARVYRSLSWARVA
jgi:hypothetical protein